MRVDWILVLVCILRLLYQQNLNKYYIFFNSKSLISIRHFDPVNNSSKQKPINEKYKSIFL